MAQILITDPDQDTCRWLESIFKRDGLSTDTAQSGEDTLKKIAHDPPKVLLLEVALPDMDGLELVRRVRRDPATDGIGIVVLSMKMRIDDIQAGLEAGADEYLSKRPGVDVELRRKIRSLAARESNQILSLSPAPRKNGNGHHGKIISFCSAKGGTGTTSICVNTAYAASRLETRAETLLMDMVLPLGMIGHSIGYESPQTVARLTQTLKGNIKPDSVQVFVSNEPAYGFHILLGANDPKEANALDATQVSELFETLRQMYDYIFVDFGRTLSCLSVPIIEKSDAIVMVLTSDTPTVKMTKLVLLHFESLGIQRHRIMLVNNRTTGRMWISRDEIENELGLPLTVSIPNELEHVTMAMNAGVPFMAKFPERTANIAFNDLAHSLLDRLPK